MKSRHGIWAALKVTNTGEMSELSGIVPPHL